jgi:hypothetical protein
MIEIGAQSCTMETAKVNCEINLGTERVVVVLLDSFTVEY